MNRILRRSFSTCRLISYQPLRHRFNPIHQSSQESNQVKLSLLKHPFSHDSKRDFETASDETLESICEHLEALIDDHPKLAEADVTLASGVLTLVLPQPYGTYVINKQSPNKQIWLSSPKSGPLRYDLQGSAWIYKHSGQSLHQLLNQEIGKEILGLQDPGFEDLYLGGQNQE